MKKTALSLSLFLVMSAACLTGCDDVAKKIDENGNEVLFTLDNVNYTADDLFGVDSDVFTYNYLSDSKGIEKFYNAIMEAIVKTEIDATDKTLLNAVDILMDEWDEAVETYADENDLTVRNAENVKLEEAGYEDRDELYAAYLLSEQMDQLYVNYKTAQYEPTVNSTDGSLTSTDSLLQEYVTNAAPAVLSHILVTIASTNNVTSQATITEAEAKKLGTVIQRLTLGNKSSNSFSKIAIAESDDSTSTYGGNLGLSDSYNKYVTEFKHGLFVSQLVNAKSTNDEATYNKYKTALKLDDDTEEALFGAAGVYKNYAIPTIDVVEVCDVLLNQYDDEADGKQYDANGTPLVTDNETAYPRNVTFNKEFNFSGIQFLTISSKSYERFPIEERSVNSDGYVVDANGNPIVVVRSQYGIHFMTITWDSLAQDPDAAVKYLMSGSGVDYFGEDYVTYATNTTYNIGYTDTATVMKSNRATAVKDAMLNYAKGGYASSITASDDLYDYRIFKYYLDESGVEIADEKIETKLLEYLDLQQSNSVSNINKIIDDEWDTYADKISYSIDDYNTFYGPGSWRV